MLAVKKQRRRESGNGRKAPVSARKPGMVRIIGGQWRGRKLAVPDVPGLRPSTDRVRETLFNWLMYDVAGARCLDAFCGSGVLGLEALSRGADSLVALDMDPGVIRQMEANLALLGSERAHIVRADVLSWLETVPAAGSFDLVFLDPPFRQGLLEPALEVLIRRKLLRPGAAVYVEHEAELGNLMVPPGLHLTKDRLAGQVRYRLYQGVEAPH